MWGGQEHAEALRAAEGEVELVGRLQVNQWGSRRTPQFVVEDVLPGVLRG